MITTHIGQDIKETVIPNLGVAGVRVFDEEDPLFTTSTSDVYHITLYSAGGERASGRATSTQAFDIEVRGKTTATSKHITELLAEYLQGTYGGQCILPVVPGVSSRIYANCRIDNIGNINNLGKDDENKVVFRVSAEITYIKR